MAVRPGMYRLTLVSCAWRGSDRRACRSWGKLAVRGCRAAGQQLPVLQLRPGPGQQAQWDLRLAVPVPAELAHAGRRDLVGGALAIEVGGTSAVAAALPRRACPRCAGVRLILAQLPLVSPPSCRLSAAEGSAAPACPPPPPAKPAAFRCRLPLPPVAPGCLSGLAVDCTVSQTRCGACCCRRKGLPGAQQHHTTRLPGCRQCEALPQNTPRLMHTPLATQPDMPQARTRCPARYLGAVWTGAGSSLGMFSSKASRAATLWQLEALGGAHPRLVLPAIPPVKGGGGPRLGTVCLTHLVLHLLPQPSTAAAAATAAAGATAASQAAAATPRSGFSAAATKNDPGSEAAPPTAGQASATCQQEQVGLLCARLQCWCGNTPA